VSHPTEEELVDLVVGDPALPSTVSAHVNACDSCAATVAGLRRTAELLATVPPDAAWQAPDPAVWRRITDELTTDELTTDDLTNDLSENEPARRHTGDELATRRGGREALGAGGTKEPGRADRGRRRGRLSVAWGVGLAAASLAIGLLAGRAIWQPETPVQPVAQVALSTLDTKQDEGKASVVRSTDGLDLTVATAKPLDAGDGYLEVWLINADGKRMVSVGVLAPGDKASFPISQSMIDQGYTIVDISREKFDGSPAHSGDSLLRGKLPA
jgi:hypothetical protein